MPLLTYVVGLAVMCSGLSSIATQSHVVAENLQRLIGLEGVPSILLALGLMLAMAAATIIYMAVAITAVSVVPWRELAAAPGPLAEVVNRAAPWFPQIGSVAITIFAVANTALLNYVMGSRLAYGMARQSSPAPPPRPHPPRSAHAARGDRRAAGDCGRPGPSGQHLAACLGHRAPPARRLHRRQRRPRRPEAPPGRAPRGSFEAPIIVPILGAVVCLSLLVNRIATGNWQAPAIAGGLILAILALYAVTRSENVVDEPVKEEPGDVPAE